MAFKFLTDNDPTFKAIWFWAKQLITELNRSNLGSGSALSAGSVTPFAGETAPTGWLLCDGAIYLTKDYPELFLAIGYKYGGEGDFFNVPNCVDRLLIGAGSIAALGKVSGSTEVTLAVDNMPSHAHDVTDAGHTHVFTGNPHTHAVTDPGHSHTGGAAAASNVGTAGAAADVVAQAATAAAFTGLTVNNATATGTNASTQTGLTINNTGGGKALGILNPVIGMNMIIKA